MHPFLRFAALAALLAGALTPRPAAGQTVLTECTQAALEDAIAGGGIIIVDCDGTIVLDSSITVDTDVTLDATGRAFAIAGSEGGDATNGVRLFQVSPGVSFSAINVTLTGGRSTNGGAIYNDRGFVTLESCVITSNLVTGLTGLAGRKGGDSDFQAGKRGHGGGSGHAAHGGAIYNFRGTTVVDRCIFLTNVVVSGRGGTGGNGGNGASGGGDGGGGGNGGAAQGGAIYNQMGALTVNNSTFYFNRVTAGAGGAGGTNGTGPFTSQTGHGGHGGVASGGVIYSTKKSRTWIHGSTFAGNRALSGASADAASSQGPPRNGPAGPNAYGGALVNYGVIACTNSTIFANGIRAGTGGRGGNSNTEGGQGGRGGYAWGGGMFNSGNAQLWSCTFKDNGAGPGTNGLEGSGLFRGDVGSAGRTRGANLGSGSGVFALGNTILSNPRGFSSNLVETNITCILTLITNVTDGTSADEIIWTTNIFLRSDGFMSSSVSSVTNENITGTGLSNGTDLFCETNRRTSTLSSDRSNGFGAFKDRGGNLSTDRSLKLNTRNRFSIITNDARLGGLADNGGLTFTIALLDDSPAIDAGSAAFCPATDQRGVPRPVGGRCDIGVYESGASVSGPAISTQPGAQTVPLGATVSFLVVASGTQPLSYEWRRDGEAIPLATSPLLTLTDVQPEDAGTYVAVVSNSEGSVSSTGALLTVVTPVVITMQPADINILQGSTAVFSVVATGSGPIGYQWYVNDTMPIPGAISDTLTLLNVATNLAGGYSVVLANGFFAATSTVATLTVQTVAPVILTNPQSLDAPIGANAPLIVTASGSLPLQFLWFHDETNLVGSFLLEAGSSTLVITNAQAVDSGVYHAVVTNISGSATSSPAVFVVIPPPEIIGQPASSNVQQGATASFRVVATSHRPIIYQWFFNQTTLLDGETNDILVLPNVATNQAGSYRVALMSSFYATNSADATLTVDTVAPAILDAPQNAAVAQGAAAQFTVVASGSWPLEFTWYHNETNLIATFRLDARTSTLAIDNAQPEQAGTYHVVVTNISGSATSAPATLAVVVPPAITAEPSSQFALRGSNVTFTTAASGTPPLAWQWYFNDALIDGATNDTLVLTNLAYTGAGAYRAVATNLAGMAGTSAATLGVLAPFTADCPPADPVICTITVPSDIGINFILQSYDAGTMTWNDIETMSGTGSDLSFMHTASGPVAPDYRVLTALLPP